MEVKLPPLGDDIKEASVSFWYKKVGDRVAEGEDLVELSTEKASFNLPAPAGGQLTAIKAGEGEKVPVGAVLAEIE